MRFRLPPRGSRLLPAAAALALILAVSPPSEAAPNAAAVPPAGFIPDTTVLARVNDSAITVRDFIRSYFNAYAADRPGVDSLGRVEFLKALINKEVLGRTARKAGYVPTFEDRVVMREYTERVLSDVLYLRAVLDSVQVTDADIQRVYDQFRYELHLRHILFADRATADRVRLDLLRGRTSWKTAVKTYSRATKDGPEGDAGWAIRVGMSYAQAEAICTLKPGEISPVIEDEDGPHLFQIIERRQVTPMSLATLRNTIAEQIRNDRAAKNEQKVFDLITSQIGFQLDTANVAWTARFFPNSRSTQREGHTLEMVFDVGLPSFSPADTSRVLARWKSGRISVGSFLHAYSDIPPLMRPPVNTPEGLGRQVANVVLEPYRAQAALERGYDKDPRAAKQIEMRREQLLVEHMYEDSVASRISVLPTERRRYYEENKAGFVTYASRRFASIVRRSQAGADSVIADLKAGRSAQAIIDADSVRGLKSGAIHDLREDEHGPFRKVVYEEMKPGDVTTLPGGKDGSVIVLQLVSVTPGRQLSFDEASAMADENIRNKKSEEALQKLLGRLSRNFRITSHPELVMRVRLVDPTL